MDTLIIEHLACLEINRLILQEPYRLVSEVQFNDKSPAFDGEILFYNSNELTKDNLEDYIKIQIKGTTQFKKIKSNKTTYSIKKCDLEVYQRTGKGILYFLVVINSKSKKMQAYYKALPPLEIARVLSEINRKNQNSLSIDFKKIDDGQLEEICYSQIKKVRRQAGNYIEIGNSKTFSTFRLEYDVLPSEIDFFDPLETPLNIYGLEDGHEYPIEAVIPDLISSQHINQFEIDNESISISINVENSRNDLIVLVENTLEFHFSKSLQKGTFNLKRLRTLSSYIKSLKTLKFVLLKDRFPFELYKISGRIDDKKIFKNIEKEIEKYENLLKVCDRIGINEDYEFRCDEELDDLFNGIMEVFGNKNYGLLRGDRDLNDYPIVRFKISNNITLLLMKDNLDDLYYSLFNPNFSKKIGAFFPKREGEFDANKDDYFNVSIYVGYPLQELISLTNFNFEVYRSSLLSDAHDRTFEINNEIALNLIEVYNNNPQNQYLELAENLLGELVKAHADNIIYKINILLIKNIKGIHYDEDDQEFLYSVLDLDDLLLQFGAHVLLGAKIPARKTFTRLSIEDQERVKKFPLYMLYEKM
ncbi:DUF4365 domain-containing protein [Exiguobacterium sp. SH0S7]|uniref:DUF4365 domain-containing protein n=1 Tax=Exiguobacterium sp. SH0S7 TaxID=2510951 RepID=UPI00103A9759|nr:DUF4365 domain-containing protein [Exiguobacterium sp. SH0S7]TCI73370.1 DUF4365 domain-containing protein [Exiguobacterium sp. SH0S7]